MDTHPKHHADQTNEAAQKQRATRPVSQGLVALTPQADLAVLQRAIADPAAALPADILALQRTVGNRAVARLIQTKLMVGPAGDRYEQEADRVADQVLTMQLPSPDRRGAGGEVQRQAEEEEEELQTKPLVQRQAEEEEELQTKPLLQRQGPEEEEEIQTKAIQQVGLGGGRVPPEVEAAIQRVRGGGQPLDGALQKQMSEAMGHDFSGVRVHADAEADDLNQQLSAKAFTTGSDIFFRQGEYNPDSGSGRELIGHELTHVVQQRTGRVGAEPSGMAVRPVGDTFEQEADDMGREANHEIRHRARQRATSKPGWSSPSDVEALQNTIGNRAVQRVLQPGVGPGRAQTSAGRPIVWQDPSTVAMNCHGHTYGTYARWKRNPRQADDGVGVIVADEAGAPFMVDVPSPDFLALGNHHGIQVGNLITVRVGVIRWAHSMRVVEIGPDINNVIVSNVQGYGGTVERIPVTQVPQVTNPGSFINVYPQTPRSF